MKKTTISTRSGKVNPIIANLKGCASIFCVSAMLFMSGCGDEDVDNIENASELDRSTIIAELTLENDARVEFHELTPGVLHISAWVNAGEEINLVEPGESIVDIYTRLSGEEAPEVLIAAYQRSEELLAQNSLSNAEMTLPQPLSEKEPNETNGMTVTSRQQALYGGLIDCTEDRLSAPPWWIQNCRNSLSGYNEDFSVGHFGYSRVCSRSGYTSSRYAAFDGVWRKDVRVSIPEGKCHLNAGLHENALHIADVQGALYDWYFAVATW